VHFRNELQNKVTSVQGSSASVRELALVVAGDRIWPANCDGALPAIVFRWCLDLMVYVCGACSWLH